MRTARTLPLCISTAMIIAGCSTPGSTPHDSRSAHDVIVGDWSLATLDGRDAQAWAREANAHAAPTLSVQPDGSVGGAAGVNRWFSTLDFDALPRGEFVLSSIGATRMAGPPDAMRLEQDYFDALARTRGFDAAALASGHLILLDGDGDGLMQFDRAAPQR